LQYRPFVVVLMMMVLLLVVAWWHEGHGRKFCSDSDDHTAACLALLTCFWNETADAEGYGKIFKSDTALHAICQRNSQALQLHSSEPTEPNPTCLLKIMAICSPTRSFGLLLQVIQMCIE
jgi:hypothetical protein